MILLGIPVARPGRRVALYVCVRGRRAGRQGETHRTPIDTAAGLIVAGRSGDTLKYERGNDGASRRTHGPTRSRDVKRIRQDDAHNVYILYCDPRA